MRLWYGKECEGHSQALTLFVEALQLSAEDIIKISQLLHLYDMHRVYFSAGRIETYFTNEVLRQIEQLDAEKIVEITASSRQIATFASIFDHIVVRIDAQNVKHFDNITLKLDNYDDCCAVSDNLLSTDISQLKFGLYDNDTEIKL